LKTSVTLSIGDLARTTDTKVETIRYYEKIGLIDQPARTGGNHRAYTQPQQDRLTFIRHARELGFSISDIRALLELAGHPDAPCADADSIARRHLAGVRSRIARLQALERELSRMLDECCASRVADCRVIEVLADHGQCSADHA
jgi:DNA-binding transcriptional MerR regulator